MIEKVRSKVIFLTPVLVIFRPQGTHKISRELYAIRGQIHSIDCILF
jgi:hypothetical protein